MTLQRGELTRCPTCERTFTQAELDGANCCPSCGTRSVPQDVFEDVTLTINWLDLRCLAQWAEKYVHSCNADQDWERLWEAVKRRLRAVKPEGAAPLTLLEELDEMRDAGFDVTLHEGGRPL